MISRSLWALIATALVAACATAAPTPSPPPPPPSPGPTSSPTSGPTPTPAAASPLVTAEPTLSPAGWPEGITVSEAGRFSAGELDVPGYLAFLPPGYADDDEPRPLLVFLHGAGESGDGSEEDLRKVLKLGIPHMLAGGTWPAEHPFVVLAPQYSEAKASGDCALADEISALLDHAELTYRVDPQRIYLTGISCGAIGIWDYLAEADPSRAAAAVPIAGHPVWAIEKAGCSLAHTATWVFHGERDEVVPVNYVEDLVEQLRSCTAPPAELELTIYPDADHFANDAWTRTYDLSAGHDVFGWMLDHRLSE